MTDPDEWIQHVRPRSALSKADSELIAKVTVVQDHLRSRGLEGYADTINCVAGALKALREEQKAREQWDRRAAPANDLNLRDIIADLLAAELPWNPSGTTPERWQAWRDARERAERALGGGLGAKPAIEWTSEPVKNDGHYVVRLAGTRKYQVIGFGVGSEFEEGVAERSTLTVQQMLGLEEG